MAVGVGEVIRAKRWGQYRRWQKPMELHEGEVLETLHQTGWQGFPSVAYRQGQRAPQWCWLVLAKAGAAGAAWQLHPGYERGRGQAEPAVGVCPGE